MNLQKVDDSLLYNIMYIFVSSKHLGDMMWIGSAFSDIFSGHTKTLYLDKVFSKIKQILYTYLYIFYTNSFKIGGSASKFFPK